MVETSKDGYIEFRFFRPNVAKVFLAGDFNDWRTDHLQMVRQDNGYWGLKLRLPAGGYKFRYVADGAWYTDYAAFGIEPGRFGMDSVLQVPEWAIQIDEKPAAHPAVAAA
ncbi:hypothetical protein LCGC14_1864620 [marine sediment metagenome]|uniref:Glycoside hydrolase family 13 N-terminal domain-containing protein n=1 Tax=marine sediment metagenome TaxID=412755 RepID=A0A0F9J5G1_9ZZZZ